MAGRSKARSSARGKKQQQRSSRKKAPAAAAAAESPRPDIARLFGFYNDLYFGGGLAGCAVEWSSRKTTLAGDCVYDAGSCRIRLSEPVLKRRSLDDVKSTLLHEMIHAHLFATMNTRNHNDHGSRFMHIVEQIKNSNVQDNERPVNGYDIRLRHSFVGETCTMSRACEDVQELVPPVAAMETINISSPSTRSRSRADANNLLALLAAPPADPPAMDPPKPPCKRPSETEIGQSQSLFKVPRLAPSFYDKNIKNTNAASKASASIARRPALAPDLEERKRLKTARIDAARRRGPPDVIIASKNWYSWEPKGESSEDEPLIDRRRERRKKVREEQQAREQSVPPGSLVPYEGVGLPDRVETASPGSLVVYQGGREMEQIETVSPWSLVLYQGSSSRSNLPLKVFERRKKKDLIGSEGEMMYLEAPPVRKISAWEGRMVEVKSAGTEKMPAPALITTVRNGIIVEAKTAGMETMFVDAPVTTTAWGRMVEAKAPAPISTVCPICNTAFEFDTTKEEDNAKFNTHVDLCLNGSLQ